MIAPTPDKITQMGIARTFQNIRLWKSQTVFENVLIAKHMRARQNVFSAAFRLNRAEEKRMREEAMALLEEQNLAHLKDEGMIATSEIATKIADFTYSKYMRTPDRPLRISMTGRTACS